MTKDDIIRMARESLNERDGWDYYDYTHKILHWWGKHDEIVKFAQLVATAEREACAKVCEEYRNDWLRGQGRYEFMGEGADYCAAAIRARGQQ